MNGGSDKKGVFNFDCLVCYKKDFLNCKKDFLNFLKKHVLQPFFPKTQGFACKSGFILEFWLHAVKLSLAWCETLFF
ncbi:hypothetical protein ID0213_00840 [Helicobacter pylori]